MCIKGDAHMALLFVVATFCCAVGYALAVYQFSVWGLAGFTFVAIVCIQVAYIGTCVVHSLWGGAI